MYRGGDFAPVATFFGIADPDFRGGLGGGPRVLVISGQTLLSSGAVAALAVPVANIFAADVANRGGIRVTAKNLDGHGGRRGSESGDRGREPGHGLFGQEPGRRSGPRLPPSST
ncbi:MAG: Flagellar hook-length control protein FliK [Gemmataceae bacterium]|nr:Flagellar hook-length control protein FliK [Gemmataceae bacterium]